MVTSRPIALIQQLFQHARCLDISANNDDVRKYIRARLSLASKTNRRDICDALERLPAEVNAIYNQAMERIAEQIESAVSPTMTVMDFNAELSLSSVCADLLVVDKNSKVIRLVCEHFPHFE